MVRAHPTVPASSHAPRFTQAIGGHVTLARLANRAAFTHYRSGLFASGGIMNAICRWGFQLSLALAAVSFASATSVHAYTPEQQQACTPDAMRLCGNYVPDVDRITACMIAKKSQLSPECRRFFRAGAEPTASTEPPPNFVRVKPKPAPAKSTKAAKPKKPAKPADT